MTHNIPLSKYWRRYIPHLSSLTPICVVHLLSQFSALTHVCCNQMAGWINMPLGREVGLDPGNIVRCEPSSPSPGRGQSPPIFGPCLLWPKVGWIKIVVGMEVGLIPGDFTLDGDLAPPQKGGKAHSPIFSPFLLWPNGCMHRNATSYGARPRPRRLCVRWGPRSPLPQRGTVPNFRSISVVAKWLHGSSCHSAWS